MTTKILTSAIAITFLISCTLVPSEDYIESDNIDNSMTNEILIGHYKPTNKAIDDLKRYYSESDINKIRQSSIVIFAGGDSIQVADMPVNSIDKAYFLSTSTDKLFIKKGHEKFWHLERSSDYFPRIKFRLKNEAPSLLIDLGIDPDSPDYFEFK